MSLTGLLAFVFILGAAVVLHEFGHFIVAKLLGIRVETFSVGFGKRIWGRRWGTTDYRLSLIPLGGYVKLGGDDSNAGLEEGSAEEIPAGERFDLRPRWQKFLVGVAGPVMNILTAIAIPLVTAMSVGVPAAPPPSPVVGRVEQGGAAQASGVRAGDRIVRYGAVENPEWKDIEGDAMLSPNQEMSLVVERDGQRVPLTIKPQPLKVQTGETIGDLGMLPDLGVVPVVRTVVPDGPAAEGGLRTGDKILKVNGRTAHSNDQVASSIQESKGPITLTIERGGAEQELVIGERRLEQGRIGIAFEPPPVRKLGLVAAASYAVNLNLDIITMTGKALGQVFTGSRSVRDTLAGPIGIAQASDVAVSESGWGGFFWMLTILSLNLGIFNLLPIPVLDGGMIFMLFVEGALAWVGLKLSNTMRERIQQVGFVFLLLLMGFVIINDVTKVASRLGGSSDSPPAATERK
jgi:regulator of sigma E protease